MFPQMPCPTSQEQKHKQCGNRTRLNLFDKSHKLSSKFSIENKPVTPQVYGVGGDTDKKYGSKYKNLQANEQR